MRHPIVIALAVAIAAAIPLVAGAAGHGSAPAPPPAVAQAAAPSPLAGLDRTFRGLLPRARCADVAAAVGTAKRQRAAALRGARTAPAKALARKKAAMRRAIAAMRRAAKRCAEAAPPGGGATPPARAPTPVPTPAPSPAPAQVITLHVAAGATFAYTETSASAAAGAMRIALENASSLRHFVAVRTAPGQPALGESPLSPVGGPTSLDITLPAGSYQVFCRNNGHDALGMAIPLTVTG